MYPALRRLVARGLLTVEETVSSGGREQRLYHATEAGRAVHLDWLRRPVDPATVVHDLGLHLMRFVMMENNLEREEVLAFLKAVADALGDFVALMERYLAANSPADRPWAEKPAPQHGRLALEHGIATHRVSLQWARSAMEALARPGSPHTLPPPGPDHPARTGGNGGLRPAGPAWHRHPRGIWVCSCQSGLLSWFCSEYVVKDDVGDSGDRHGGDYFERG